MKHKTRTKALSWLLSLAMVLSLIPGMSMTAYADEPQKYALTFSGGGRTVTPHKGALPITFNSAAPTDYSWGSGALDDIIGQLYWSPGTCAQVAPTVVGGSDAVTVGLNNNYQYITINQYFDGTVTVTGKFSSLNDGDINYSVSITCVKYEEYPLWVNGVQVTSENKDDVLGDSDEGATVTYTPAAGTTPAALTLNNANITKGHPNDNGESGIYYDGAAPLDIVLAEGSKNKIKKIADELDPDKDFRYGGIYSADTNAAVTISGTGTLTAKGIYYGIKAEKDVTIKSGNVSAEGLVVGISAANAVTIKGGTVAATATFSGDTHGIFGGKNVTIEGGVVIASATGNGGDGIKAYDGDVVIRDGDITASGAAQAIKGTVKNAIAGTGWTNTEGTEGQASIAVNTTGQDLTYKKVRIKAMSYGVWVGGEEVTSANLSGEGWSYTPATDMGDFIIPANLTLNGYSYEGAGHAGNTFSGAIYAEQDLKIKLDGGSSNSVISAGNDAATSCAIYAGGDLTIYGSGSLTASGPMGIVCGGNMTVTGGTITVTGKSRAISADTVTIDERMYVKAGTDEDNSSAVADTSNWAHTEKWVKAKVFARLYVGGTEVTKSNAADVFGDGKVSFDPDTYTLTLNGYNYSGAGHQEGINSFALSAGHALNIVLKNENTVINSKKSDDGPDYGISVMGDLSISGTGSLTTRGQDDGIIASKDITFNGGTVNVTDDDGYLGDSCIFSNGSITVNSGSVTASGVSRWGAINADNSITINGGTVNATATGQESYALCAGAVVTINGGLVNANATGNNSLGIASSYYDTSIILTINGGTVTASGNTQAISGTVKNAIAGTGWTDTEGTVGKASIPTSTDGQTLDSYKKIQFLGHTHTFTSYTLNDAKNTITAECSNADGKCKLSLVDNKHTATLTIAPKDDGTAALTGGADFSVTDADIKYTKDNVETTADAIKTAEGAAFYKASITVGKDNNTATAEVTYGVNEVKKDTSFNKTTANGDFTVPKTATVGATVSIVTTPDDGYQLASITANNLPTGTEGNTGTFTMPPEEVTVSATFAKRNVGVSLAVVKDYVTEESVKASCSAALLKDDAGFTPVGNSFTSQVDDTFILRVDSDEAYDFTITGTTPLEFIQLDKAKKQSYVRTHPDVDANTQLFLVTMPGVQEGDLTVTVTFQKIKTYTILFQPNNPAAFSPVWCKVANEFGGQNTSKSFQLKMNPDAQMGNVKTFAVTVSMLAAPQKIAFGDSELAPDAPMTSVSVTESVQAVPTWTDGFSGKYLVIGGYARTVIAAFTPNNTPYTARTDDVRNLPANTKYQIAVCGVGAAGTVKAPAALTKNGFTFVGWGYKSGALGLNEKDTYDAGDDISITDDAIFGAVWTPVTPTVTVNLKGGDINGNTDSVTISNVQYNEAIREALQNILPKKNGFALDGWTVNANVTEGGKFFSRGSAFDPNTNITSNLELNAKWKHVHSYTCVPLDYAGFGDALKDYYEYRPYMHVKFCGCYDVELEAHSFENGVCTGCKASESGGDPTLTLDVSYWKDGEDGAWMREATRTGLKENEEVTVSAFYQIGDYRFSKWQYSTNGSTWYDLAATTMVGFIIPKSMQVRALYTEVEIKPQVSLSASKYVTEAEGHEWDTVLFQMEYKLPSNCTYIDSGIRMGDNQGISFYSLRKRKVSAFETAFNFITSDPISFAADSLTSDPDYIIEKREDNVLGTMNAATLAKYMMEKKPINIPEYEPIYWQANPATKGRSGSVNTLTPLRFIQKNNGNHYIYGVAYLRFKDSNGEHTIYTEAIPVTRNTIPEKNTVTKTFTPN